MSDGKAQVVMPAQTPERESEDFGGDGPDRNLLAQEASGMLQLEVDDSIALHPSHGAKSPQLTFLDVFAVIVGMAIGSGIFASPSRVDSNVPSPGIAIITWIVAGIFAWTGAASFAELGTAIPKNGGMQEYLLYIYGDFLASVMSWTWIIVVKPSSIALLSIIFADYWASIIFPSSPEHLGLVKLIALTTVACVLLINCISAKSSTGLTNGLLFSKLATVALIMLIAMAVILFGISGNEDAPSQDWKSKDWFASRGKDENGSSIDWSSLSTWDLLGRLTTALYAALFALGGWDNANLVVAEMRDPNRDLPRAVHTAIPMVTICFVLTNIAYYIILPWRIIPSSDAIAVAVGRQALGTTGGLLFAILVSASCLGVLNIDFYTTGILTVTSARHGYLPMFLVDPDDGELFPQRAYHANRSSLSVHGAIARLKGAVIKVFRLKKSTAPIRAMVFNALIACPYIFLGTFGPLVTLSGIAGYFFLLLTVLGVLILRHQQPSLHRPYKPSFWAPVIFCCFSGFLVVRGVVFAPVQGLLLGGLMVVGGGVHWFRGRGRVS